MKPQLVARLTTCRLPFDIIWFSGEVCWTWMEHDDIKHKAMKAMRNDTGCKREEWNCRKPSIVGHHREGGGIAAMVLNAWKGHLLTRRQREQLYVLEPRFFAGQSFSSFHHLVTSCHSVSQDLVSDFLYPRSLRLPCRLLAWHSCC